MSHEASPAMLEQIASQLDSAGKTAWAQEIRLAATENKRLVMELRRLHIELARSADRIERVIGNKNEKN